MKTTPNFIAYLLVSTALVSTALAGTATILTGCQSIAPQHSQVVESANPSNYNSLKTTPTIEIDWSQIDSGPKVLKNNRPRDIIYPRSTIDLAKAVNRPVADIYRHHTVYESPEVQQVLNQIKTQLGDSYVDVYGNAEGIPKYFVVTRQNVAAESYEYVIKTGEAKGFSIDFEILPIADRNKKALLDAYDSNEDRKLIEDTVRKHGGELQGIGYTPIGFTVVVTVYFSNGDISDEKLRQLENELKYMTKANVTVEQARFREPIPNSV
ncbi:hypothetical protein [Psychrobacter sp.]|uniref:hypothetical protein n=1 Tax=Psychrobacter sp. TaxID=56811 RepID=UPI0025EC11FF|nr:hypothetical protein [Psychrobacter sp.]